MSNADPEVHTMATGFCRFCATPSAKKAAHRSSTILMVSKSLSFVKPMVRGAFLEPGEITTVSILKWRQAEMMICANSFFVFFKEFSPTKVLLKKKKWVQYVHMSYISKIRRIKKRMINGGNMCQD